VTFPAEGGAESVPVDVDPEPIVCRVRETARGEAGHTRITPRRVSLSVATPTADVTVTNTYE
jgi:hypothetical protein